MAHDDSVFSNIEQVVLERLAILKTDGKFKLIHSFPGTLIGDGANIDPLEFFGPQNPNIKVMVTPVLGRKETDDPGDLTVDVTCFLSVVWGQTEAIARLGNDTHLGLNGLVEAVWLRLDEFETAQEDSGGVVISQKLEFNRSRVMYQDAGRWIMELVFNDSILRTSG